MATPDVVVSEPRYSVPVPHGVPVSESSRQIPMSDNNDKPQPGEMVRKETSFGSDNRLKVVPDSRWNDPDDDLIDPVGEDEYVTQSMNSLGILGKQSMDDTVREGGEWVIKNEDGGDDE